MYEPFNKLMLEGKDAFDPALENLLCNTDELMGAPFFWHADVVPLCAISCRFVPLCKYSHSLCRVCVVSCLLVKNSNVN